jgi:hypothetical protein
MIQWISDNQDFILFTAMTIIAFLGYVVGSMCKNDEIKYLINDYENLLNLAYTDKQNLMVALASIQGRQEGQYLGYQINNSASFDTNCDCQICERLRNQ